MGRYAGVRPRGRGWEASWRDATGKQVSKCGFAREKDAHDFRVDQLASIGKGTYVDPQAGKMTVGEQYSLVQRNRRVSRGRHAAEASYASNHVLPRWRDVPLRSVTEDDVQAWINDLADRLAPRTVRECHRILKTTLEAATRARPPRIAANPCATVKAPAVPTKRLTHEDVLDVTELGAVVRAVEVDRWRALVLLIGWLGPRLSEALGVRRCDVNLLLGTITFGRVVVEEVQGNPHPRTGGKTENAERVVPLPPSLAKALEAHMALYVDAPADSFLFLQDGTHPSTRAKDNRHPSRGNLLRHALKPAVAIAGISVSASVRLPSKGSRQDRWVVRWYDPTGHERRHDFLFDAGDEQSVRNAEKEAHAHVASLGPNRLITFRQLRHSAASIQFDLGVDPNLVSEWLGHYKPSFTMDTYKHVLKHAEQVGTQAIEQAMRGAM